MLAAYVFLRFWPRELWDLIVRQQSSTAPAGMVLDYSAAALVSLERQLAILLSLFMLFLLNRTGYIRPPLFKTLFVLLVFCDLYSAHQRLQYLLDPKSVVDSPRVLVEPDNPPTRLFYYPESENLHPAMYVIHKQQTSFREVATMLASN